MDYRPRIGVYICHCGVNISRTVDIDDLTAFARGLPGVDLARHYAYMCSDPGQLLIKKDIRRNNINRVVVASCSPRMHEVTFRRTLAEAGLNPFYLEIANIREHCSWVHSDQPQATAKAKKLVAAAAAKAALLEALRARESSVEPSVLIIGGGIAGIQAALDIANAGYQVYLVEKSPSLGGRMAQLDKTFPTLDCSACILTPKMVDVAAHAKIELLTYAEVESIDGYAGNFAVRVRKKARYVDSDRCTACGICARECRLAGRIADDFNAGLSRRAAVYLPFPQAVPAKYTIDRDHCLYLTRGKCGQSPRCAQVCPAEAIDFRQQDEIVSFKTGAIIVATGFDLFDPARKPEYAYGDYDNVITGLEMERLLSASGPTNGRIVIETGGQVSVPLEIAFISCVGSRDKKVGNEYCSRVCCMYTAKQAHMVKEKIPEAKVRVYYMDVRAFGKGYQEFYARVRGEGIRYIRGNPSEIYRRGDKLVIRAEDTLSSTPIEDEVDLVVLAVGLEQRKDADQLNKILRLSRSGDRFYLEAHPKLAPLDTLQEGVFLAGCAQGPKDIPDSVAQAKGAAASALTLLCSGRVRTEAQISCIDEAACRGCGTCAQICPYQAIEMTAVTRSGRRRTVARVNEILCKGCGSCVAGCLSGALQQKSFTDGQLLRQIAVLGGRAMDHHFEPQIIAFLCHWCSYAGADLAGTSRMEYAANVRVIRVMCTSRINPLFVINAFQQGADGVLIAGCHPGDCHYKEGNYHTWQRMSLMRKLLAYIGVEPERLNISWVSAAEGQKWQELVAEVVERVRRVGPFQQFARSTGNW